MSEDGHGVSSGMRAKGDWGCRPFPLMQSPSPCPAGRHNATATDLNPRYNSLHRSYPRLSPSGSSFDCKRGVSRRFKRRSLKIAVNDFHERSALAGIKFLWKWPLKSPEIT